MGWGSNTSAAQRCIHHPPLQKGKSPALWQLQRNLSPDHSRKDIGTGYAQTPDSPLGTRPTSRESMRIPRWPWDRWHDLRGPPTTWRNAKSSMTTSSITLLDLAQAFDTVCRDGLWLIMETFGCPRKCTALVRHYMTEWGPQFLTTVILRIHFQSQTEWNRAVFRPLPSSAWYSLSCFTTLHSIMTMASNWSTEQMEECSTSDDSKQKTKVKAATLK